ncbi:ERAD-associated protein [Teratosphaeriaceae sp. CCFEE 6253]|nr:ERAD-associated protein [Teratosphaeriaceae sp. CCFEE 6253]
MKGHPSWRIAPLLLLAFFIPVTSSTARKETRPNRADQIPLRDSPPLSESAKWHGANRQAGGASEEQQIEMAEAVKEATALLRRVKAPTLSKLARYTRKPKGFLGTSAYYAKEAFVLLFNNAPKEANLLTTSTSTTSQTKLGAPLSRAVKLLQDAAEQGDADAIFLLAEMCLHGNFTHPVSYAQAFNYYKQLADLNGNSTAQYMLGFMHATGLNPDVPADQAKSMLYHTFAAEQDNTRSQMTLAYRHHAGIATPRNCDEAVHWYKMVADKAIDYYRSGPPGGHVLSKDSYSLANEVGGVYGEGASVSSAGIHAKQGGVTSDAYADVDDVLEYLHLQSSKKDLKATFGLARLHYDGGRGMKRDMRAAKQYFMQVAREYWSETGKTKKDVPAGTEKLASKAAGYLGRMFLRGEGMEQSYSKARIWFTRGLANGDALCQYSLGLMHMQGLGVPQNTAKAADFFAAAADQDLAVAQTSLGMLFLDQGDAVTATRYFELAARNSHIEAFYYLAELSNQGIGRDRSCGVASAYYKIVVEKAEAVWGSMSEAYEAYEEGDTQKAIVTYLMAAEQGSESAQANVAWLLDQTKPTWSPFSWLFAQARTATTAVGDAALALLYWTRSAKQQNIDSLVKMGDYYLSGLGTPASAEHAAACYQAAAETLQSAQAMWNLGWMHENGVGIDQDFHLAKRFYDQALETNSREAYLPVKLSLLRLRWRSWWNDVTHGGVKSMGSDDAPAKRRSFAEWVRDFLEADAQMYAQELEEADDWGAEQDGGGMGSDGEFWGAEGEIDDGVLETLLIGGLVVALGWLVWYRQQQQQRAAEERQRREGVAGQAPVPGDGQREPAPPAAAAPGQQDDGGFFPQPGEPDWNAWVAGGVGH